MNHRKNRIRLQDVDGYEETISMSCLYTLEERSKPEQMARRVSRQSETAARRQRRAARLLKGRC